MCYICEVFGLFQPGFEEDTGMETPIVRYCAVSGIEASHKAAVTDVQWVPDHMEVKLN